MITIVLSVAGDNPVTVQCEAELDWPHLDACAQALVRSLTQALLSELLLLKDKELSTTVAADWENLGIEKRTVLTCAGWTQVARRVYRDEEGRRRKPLDEVLGLAPYQRASGHVEEMGAYLASQGTYRISADVLGQVVGEAITPSRIQKMVWKVGADLEAAEARERQAVFGEGAELAGGGVEAEILFGESDGTFLSLQREEAARVEARVAVMYSGKEAIAAGRRRLVDKVVVTGIPGSSEEWQETLLQTVHRHFDLKQTKYLVVGGDGAEWVKHGFDRLDLPTCYQLDRYHMYRAVRGVPRSAQGEMIYWMQRGTKEGFGAVEERMEEIASRYRGKPLEKIQDFVRYLRNNREGLVDYRTRLGLDERQWSGLGAIEGNVDKLAVRRMKGRGMSWRMPGARAMLALIRQHSELRAHAVKRHAVPLFQERPSAVPPRRSRVRDADYLRKEVPIIHSHLENDPEVQWLKRRINGLPILSFPQSPPWNS
jgi:hypothetical protein